jgi:hypothetical protein
MIARLTGSSRSAADHTVIDVAGVGCRCWLAAGLWTPPGRSGAVLRLPSWVRGFDALFGFRLDRRAGAFGS